MKGQFEESHHLSQTGQIIITIITTDPKDVKVWMLCRTILQRGKTLQSALSLQ